MLTVLGRCGIIDYSKSERIIKQPFPPNGAFVEVKIGLHFEIHSWDGSDIFTPENSLFVFITKRVKEIIENNKISNIEITCLNEYEFF